MSIYKTLFPKQTAIIESIALKVKTEVYNKANQIEFDNMREFLRGEEWHWNNGADYEHLAEAYQIYTFYDFLEVNYNLTPEEKLFIEENY